MSNFYLDTIVKSPKFHSTNPINDIDLLEPNMKRKVLALLDESRKLGHPLYAFETYRSTDRQLLLYQRGVTKLKHVGVHHYGLACDLVQKDSNGNFSWEMDYKFLRTLAHNHQLIYGGDWHGFPDEVHCQWCAVRDQPNLFANKWYPKSDYNPYSNS